MLARGQLQSYLAYHGEGQSRCVAVDHLGGEDGLMAEHEMKSYGNWEWRQKYITQLQHDIWIQQGEGGRSDKLMALQHRLAMIMLAEENRGLLDAIDSRLIAIEQSIGSVKVNTRPVRPERRW